MEVGLLGFAKDNVESIVSGHWRVCRMSSAPSLFNMVFIPSDTTKPDVSMGRK